MTRANKLLLPVFRIVSIMASRYWLWILSSLGKRGLATTLGLTCRFFMPRATVLWDLNQPNSSKLLTGFAKWLEHLVSAWR